MSEPLTPEREKSWRAYIDAACREVEVVPGGLFDMSTRLFATLDAARSSHPDRLEVTLDEERLADAMSEAFTYEEDECAKPTLPFYDDFEAFWDPFAKVVAREYAALSQSQEESRDG